MRLRGKAVRAVGIALVLVGVTAIPAAATGYGVGWDIPSCAAVHADGAIALLPVNAGVGFTANSCLGAELAATAGQRSDLYVNGADYPPSPNWPADCAGALTTTHCSTEYGTSLAAYDIGQVTGVISSPQFWWIDVESANNWNLGPANNIAVIQAMIDRLKLSSGLVSGVGIYSSSGTTTNTNWAAITGSDRTHFTAVPLWSSSPSASELTARGNCSTKASFAGGPVVLTQFARADATDGDVICPPVVTASTPKEGSSYSIKGTGLPRSIVSVSVHETDRIDPAKFTTVAENGNWSIPATARYNASVTASTVSLGVSSSLGSVKVTPAVNKVKISAGACSVTVSGSITPYVAGMGVSLATKGHGSTTLKVTKNKAGAGVITKKTVHEACGAKVLVAITTSGKAKGKTYSQALTTANVKWTTVHTRA